MQISSDILVLKENLDSIQNGDHSVQLKIIETMIYTLNVDIIIVAIVNSKKIAISFILLLYVIHSLEMEYVKRKDVDKDILKIVDIGQEILMVVLERISVIIFITI